MGTHAADVAIMDSQSVKTIERGGVRGFDAHKCGGVHTDWSRPLSALSNSDKSLRRKQACERANRDGTILSDSWLELRVSKRRLKRRVAWLKVSGVASRSQREWRNSTRQIHAP
jgi:hypothetical protein